MTKKQKEIYDFIISYIKENLYTPSVREICKGVNLSSSSTVYGHLHALQKKGYIEIKENQPRAIRVKGYVFVKENENEHC